MNISKILSSVKSLVPDEENLKNRLFYFKNKNIYFEGDRSEFVIYDVVEEDVEMILTFSKLEHLKQLEGKIVIERLDDFTINVSDEKLTFKIMTKKLDNYVPLTVLEKPEESESLYDLFGNTTKIFDFVSDGLTTLVCSTIDDKGYILAKREDRLAINVLNRPVNSIDYTKIAKEIKNAILKKADMAINGRKLEYYLDIDSTKVFVSNVMEKAAVSSSTEKYVSMMISDKYKDKVDYTVTFDGNEIRRILNILNDPDEFADIELIAKDNKLNITGYNRQSETVSTIIPCTNDHNVKFKIRQMDSRVYNFVTEPFGGIDKSTMKFEILTQLKLMIISAIPKSGNNDTISRVIQTINI